MTVSYILSDHIISSLVALREGIFCVSSQFVRIIASSPCSVRVGLFGVTASI
jgi:hypothetical protein